MNTYNISDLSLIDSYISVSYADKKLTVLNKQSLIGAYASSQGSSQGAIYTKRVQKDVDMYVDVTLESAGVEKLFVLTLKMSRYLRMVAKTVLANS
ncbi:MAG: hypothetical protein L6V82_08740 [Clostridiales bacterium]|nr:MAG: hypothetical protein L6V82_08740 [Clostridiales bacterium]